jgi:hypothetical protein
VPFVLVDQSRWPSKRQTDAKAAEQLFACGVIGRELAGLTSGELEELARRPATTSTREGLSRALARDADNLTHRLSSPLSSNVVNDTARGGTLMAVRDSVRGVRRRLAEPDSQHARAVANLDRASARREELMAEQDRQLTVAPTRGRPELRWPTR